MSRSQTKPMPRPWLAGVCAWIAWKLDWNVLGVRAAAVLMLLLAPVATAIVYLAGALGLGLWVVGPAPKPDKARPGNDGPLSQRIDSMEARLAAFDEELRRRG